MPKAAIAHAPDGNIDIAALIEAAKAWQGLENADLAADVSQDAKHMIIQSGSGISWRQDFQRHEQLLSFMSSLSISA